MVVLMKKRFLFIAVLMALLGSCLEEEYYYVDGGPKTTVYFANVSACTAIVYNDARRRDEDFVTEIQGESNSRAIAWEPGMAYFYFSYRVRLLGVSGFDFYYRPIEVGVGKDQTMIRVDENKQTAVPIPGIGITVPSSDTPLSDKSYILIQSETSAFRLQMGAAALIPENFSDSLVNSGEQAVYSVAPGPVSAYKLLVSPDEKPFPGTPANFEAGSVYVYSYSGGNLAFDKTVAMRTANIATKEDRRSVMIHMRDSANNGWNDNAGLRININGANLSDNATLPGGGEGYEFFSPYVGDRVKVYWSGGGPRDIECAFTIYYGRDSSKVLVSKNFNIPAGAVGSGTLMGSFTVTPPY